LSSSPTKRKNSGLLRELDHPNIIGGGGGGGGGGVMKDAQG